MGEADAASSLLAEVKRTNERVIAIVISSPDIPGIKGTVLNYDNYYVDFLSDRGKREMLPRAQYKFRRIMKEGPK